MAAVALADDRYTTKYDNVDLDTILTSDRLLKNYVNCLLDKGSCTPDGKELKGEPVLLIITARLHLGPGYHCYCYFGQPFVTQCSNEDMVIRGASIRAM